MRVCGHHKPSFSARLITPVCREHPIRTNGWSTRTAARRRSRTCHSRTWHSRSVCMPARMSCGILGRRWFSPVAFTCAWLAFTRTRGDCSLRNPTCLSPHHSARTLLQLVRLSYATLRSPAQGHLRKVTPRQRSVSGLLTAISHFPFSVDFRTLRLMAGPRTPARIDFVGIGFRSQSIQMLRSTSE